MYKHNRKNTPLAKQLRKNMTKEERHLWFDYLRSHPTKFYRQKVIGPYIVDFYCAKAKLVIELDGSQHYEPAEMDRDTQRTKYLKSHEVFVLRIPNNEVMNNFSGVCEYIDHITKERIM